MRPIEEIKDRLDLVDMVGRDAKLQQEGNHHVCRCVFHRENTASMHVYESHYHCFGCGAHGDVFDYYQKTQNLDFTETLRELAKLANVILKEDRESVARREEHLSRVSILRKAAEHYHSLLTAEVRDYLHGRGFTDDFLASYLIGWAPGGTIAQIGISVSDLKKAGLLNNAGQDYFRQRIIFPVWGRYEDEIIDLAGRVVGDGRPKFLKLAGDLTLLNERGMRGQREVYLTEGDTDTASAVQLSLPVVGVRGVNGLKDEFVERFARVETIYVCADSDTPKVDDNGKVREAGKELVKKAGALFGNRARIVTIPRIELSDGGTAKDVNDYALKAKHDLKALARNAPTYLDWLIGQIPDPLPMDQIDAQIQIFVPPLKQLSKAGQDAYSRKLAQILKVNVGSIREELRVAATKEASNGHAKNGIDGTQIIWGDKPMINPAQALVDGVMHTTVFLDKQTTDEEGNNKIVTLPHIVNSRRELFELTEAEMFKRNLRYAPTKIPSFNVLGPRWRIGPEVPFSVKNYIDGGVSVDPWDVYSEVVNYFRRYLWYPNPLYYDFLAIWTCATYFFELFQAFPYVHLLGTKRCGKTLTLEIIDALAFNAFMSSSLTGAAAYRTVEMCSATLLIDEAENLQKRDKDADSDSDKLEILKAGYKRGGRAIRCSGDNHEPTSYDVYSPKVFGGTMAIDRILGDRVIALTLARKDKDATVAEFNRVQHTTALHQTRDKLHVMMLEQGKEISERVLEGIQWSGVADRDRELWTPILILAAFFDDYFLAQLGDDTPVDTENLLTAKMRSLAAESVVERQARDRLDQIEVVIIEAILDYMNETRPLVDDWYAAKPMFEYLQSRDELSWMKSITRIYNELEKMTAINKAQDMAQKRPTGADKSTRVQRCVRLNRERLLAIGKRLGAAPAEG